VPELVLLTVEGLHVPVIPLLDVVGKAGAIPPEQIAAPAAILKVGVRLGFTVTVNVNGVVHCPPVGVNV
jgi:hypothetical protein